MLNAPPYHRGTRLHRSRQNKKISDSDIATPGVPTPASRPEAWGELQHGLRFGLSVKITVIDGGQVIA